MTAVILAGGDGLRLRPLTCTMPKAMLSVANVPLIDYTLDILEQNKFTDCIIAADRLSGRLTEYLDDGCAVDFSISENPMGTSHALSEAAKKTADENITAVYSDILFDFDLSEINGYHVKTKSDITLAVFKSSHPSNHIVAVSENGVVTGISGTTPKESCVSTMAVTGVIAINTELAKNLPEYGEDILIDCIPSLIKNGVKVSAFTVKGFWLDINTSDDYFEANRAVLSGAVKISEHFKKDSSGKKYPKVKTEPPFIIDETADIEPGASILPYSVIGENATVCKGAKINGGIVLSNTFVGERATVNHAVIGEGARVLSEAGVFEGAVIGAGSVVSENAVINKGVRIWNETQVEPYSNVRGDIKYGFLRPLEIGEEGVEGETNGIITPQTASVIGSSMISLDGKNKTGKESDAVKIGVGYSETRAAYSLALAVASGAAAAGGNAWIFGETTEPGLAFCVKTCGLSAGCFIDAGVAARIKFVSSDGLPLTREEERIIEAGLNRNEYRRAAFTHFGSVKDCPEITELYYNRLKNLAPSRLTGIRAVVNTAGKKTAEAANAILSRINDPGGVPIVFHISGDGRKVSAYTDETGYVFHEKLVLLCCQREFQKGLDIALPFDFPTIADNLANRYGSTVYRYSRCAPSKDDEADSFARAEAAKKPFFSDGLEILLIILESLSSCGKTLKEAVDELPVFATSNRFVPLDGRGGKKNSIEVLRNICTERQAVNDGIVINDDRGRVLIRPVKTGRGVMMHVESYEMEAASELCDFYQDLIVRKLDEPG